MRWEPQPHHRKALRFVAERACAGLFLDPGLGKTSVMLALISSLLREGVIRAALVLAPLRVAYSVWPIEAQKWDEFRHLSIAVLHGSRKDALLAERHDAYVVNYEGLPWLEKALGALRGDWPFDALVVDESSKIKNMRTERYRILRPMLRRFRRRYALTGSPAPNTLLDLYGQLYAIDMGATFGPYFTRYRERYFYPTGYGGYEWRLKDGAEDEIHAATAPRALRLASDDYQALPRLIVNDVSTPLPGAARRIYDEMERRLFAQIGDGSVTAVNAGVASGKCRQIAGGAVYVDDAGSTWTRVHDAKIEALEDLLEEIGGHPTMIVYEFRHELERLRALHPGAPVLGDRTTPKEGARIVDAWNRGELPVLFVHPQSAGHGLNLQGAGHGQIWFAPTWNFEDYDQTCRRMWRTGRERPVFVHRLIAERTIDEAVVAALAAKDRRQSALLGALRDYWKRRRT